MKFYQHESDYSEFVGIDPFLAEIIRQIPRAANPDDDEKAKARLFASPSERNDELAKDWRELVVPDLVTQFGAAVSLVEHDLAENLTGTEGEEDFPYRLRVPADHVDAWLSALNQARLVLASRHAFTDHELSEQFQPRLSSVRDLALYQITIYGWMQELLLTTLP